MAAAPPPTTTSQSSIGPCIPRSTTPGSFCQDANGDGVCARTGIGESANSRTATIRAVLDFGMPTAGICRLLDDPIGVSDLAVTAAVRGPMLRQRAERPPLSTPERNVIGGGSRNNAIRHHWF